YVSYFDVMPDAIFATYQARGLTSRADVIISRADRDAHPLQCGGKDQGGKDQKEAFAYPADYDPASDYTHLSGYIAPSPPPSGPQSQPGSGQPGNRQSGSG